MSLVALIRDCVKPVSEAKKPPFTYGRKQVDVVVCTKDRSHHLCHCIPMIKKLVPHQNLWVFDGTEKPDWQTLSRLIEDYGIIFYHVPNFKLGRARNLALNTSQADYVAMIDDDVILDQRWFQSLMKEFDDPQVVVANSKIVYGSGYLAKLFDSSNRGGGGSAGATIYDRKAVLAVGNFNPNIHRGEDTELSLRIAKAKKKWVKNNDTITQHPLTLKEFLNRSKTSVSGWDFIMKHSPHKLKFILTRFAATFVTPIYYLWRTGDLRCCGVWFIYKLKSLLYYLSGRYVI